MNEDVYRAYDRLNDRMIYYTWENLMSAAVATGYCNHEIPDNIRKLIRIAEYDYSKQMRMRFIGVTSSNGLDIYENDIVRSQYTLPSVVHYNDSGLLSFGDTQPFDGVYPDEKWVVIGHIYTYKGEYVNDNR